MKFRQWFTIFFILLGGCSSLQPGLSSSPWEKIKPATREQKQRIIDGESASTVFKDRSQNIGVTIDLSKLWDD